MRTIVPQHGKMIPPEAKRVFQGVMYDVYQWPQLMYDGSHRTFEMLRRVDTVKVLAIKDGKLVVLHEEQPTHGRYYAFPGGKHDHESETEQEAAARELHEETGLVFRDYKLVEIIQPSDEVDWFIYFYLATGLVREDKVGERAGEKVQVKLLDLAQVKKLSRRPDGEYLRKELLEQFESVDQLVTLPEYPAVPFTAQA